MNTWLITGRLVKDAEAKEIGSGNNIGDIVAFIQVASRRNFKKKEEKDYKSDFFRFKVFGNTAHYVYENLQKGDLVEINASVLNNNYEKDGEKVFRDDFIVNGITRLSKAKPEREMI